MAPKKRIPAKKHRSATLHVKEDDAILSAEAVDTFLLPKEQIARNYKISGREIGTEAADRRFFDLERHFHGDLNATSKT